MRRTIAQLLVGAFVASSAVLFSSPASAALDSCGSIDISGNSNCELVVSGGCTAKCTPVNFTAQCSANLYVGCEGSCNANFDVQCTGSCQAECEAECNIQPAQFDCSAACEADCGANCDASCAAAADGAQCRASCRATCSGECSAQCDLTPGSADCKTRCTSCCQGSCTAEANMDCQIQCQAGGYATCEANLQGGCEAQCSKPEGALFCDGQFVDAGDKLQQCLADLEAMLSIDVKGYADGHAECSGNTCTAEGEAGFSCAAAPTTPSGHGYGAAALAALGLGTMVARRRKRS